MEKIMKHFIKLGVLGLALSMTITACTYNKEDEKLTVKPEQKTIALVLGDSHISYIYNVKQPQDVFLYAPSGYKILIGNEQHDKYKKHIKPQEMINMKFKVIKDGDDIKNAKEIDKLVFTFKENAKPINQRDIMEKSGKSTYRKGDANYFKVTPNQKDILIESHEYNKGKRHDFYYSGVKNDMKFKLIAPKYHSFIFNGKPVKEYNFTAKKDKITAFSMTLKPDWSDNTELYQREYYINLKNKM